jgi:hypothetical protein
MIKAVEHTHRRRRTDDMMPNNYETYGYGTHQFQPKQIVLQC